MNKNINNEQPKNKTWVFATISNEEEIFKVYKRPDIDYKFSNKMVNEDNDYLLEVISDDFNEFLFKRVIQGLIPLAEISSDSDNEIKEFLQRVDRNKFIVDDFLLEMENINCIYLAPIGKIMDLFDLDAIEDDYRECGIPIKIKRYQHLNLIECYHLMQTEEVFFDLKTSICLRGLIHGMTIDRIVGLLYQYQLDDTQLSSLFTCEEELI